MKITSSQLKKLIQEELQKLSENAEARSKINQLLEEVKNLMTKPEGLSEAYPAYSDVLKVFVESLNQAKLSLEFKSRDVGPLQNGVLPK